MSQKLSKASQGQLGRVARGGAVNLVGAVVNAATSFFLVVAVARYFPEDTAGMLFSATSVFLILVSVGALGTDTGMARFLLRYEARGQHGDALAALRTAFLPVAAMSLSLTVILFASAGWIAPRIGLGQTGGSGMLRVLAAMIPFAALSAFALAGTRAIGRMRPSAVIESITRSIIQVAAVVLVGAAGGGRIALTLGWGLPYAVAAVLAVVVAGRMLRERRHGWPSETRSEPGVVRREFWTYTWPRSIARICQMAIQRADIVLVGALIGARQAAVYTAATRFVVLGQFAVQAIQQVLQPRFSELLARGELDVTRDVFKISTAWSIALSFPMYLTAACAAPIYLQIFGSGYKSAGSSVVVVMALGMMLGIAAGPLDTLLLMAGRSTTSLLNAIVALVIDIGLCLILIPRIGIVGAAIAWALAVVVRNALTFVQVHGTLGVTPLSQASAIATTASVAFFAVPLILVRLMTELTVPLFLITTALGAVLYLAVLWAARKPLALTALRALTERRDGTRAKVAS